MIIWSRFHAICMWFLKLCRICPPLGRLRLTICIGGKAAGRREGKYTHALICTVRLCKQNWKCSTSTESVGACCDALPLHCRFTSQFCIKICQWWKSPAAPLKLISFRFQSLFFRLHLLVIHQPIMHYPDDEGTLRCQTEALMFYRICNAVVVVPVIRASSMGRSGVKVGSIGGSRSRTSPFLSSWDITTSSSVHVYMYLCMYATALSISRHRADKSVSGTTASVVRYDDFSNRSSGQK